MTNKSVLQDWIIDLPLTKQTILLLACRGTDTGGNKTLKSLVRWYRSKVLKNGKPGSDFMRFCEDDLFVSDVFIPDTNIFEQTSTHYISHLFEAFFVLCDKHPNEDVRDKARVVLIAISHFMGFLKALDKCVFDEKPSIKDWVIE